MISDMQHSNPEEGNGQQRDDMNTMVEHWKWVGGRKTSTDWCPKAEAHRFIPLKTAEKTLVGQTRGFEKVKGAGGDEEALGDEAELWTLEVLN